MECTYARQSVPRWLGQEASGVEVHIDGQAFTPQVTTVSLLL